MKIRVTVTKCDIEKGFKGSAFSCPIALALDRKTIHTPHVGFGSVEMRGLYGGEFFDYVPLPQKAKDFVKNFDSGKQVKPFRFTLEVKKKFLKGKVRR